MRCPKCDAYYTKVNDSRTRAGNIVARRRECNFCGYRYTTFEITATEKAKMEKTIINLERLVSVLENIIKQTEQNHE